MDPRNVQKPNKRGAPFAKNLEMSAHHEGLAEALNKVSSLSVKRVSDVLPCPTRLYTSDEVVEHVAGGLLQLGAGYVAGACAYR